ncbi:hypothetical protein Anapl_03827 [Anas platyrhynchos]|uniref:Uncharacterized protein n=1 Tax=Anas platyrhynchos TaxID=8839 RepID=R0L7G2_ANAPL|nr:hypothetical protein Anapl_03827 [Anas platyrhynchos]
MHVEMNDIPIVKFVCRAVWASAPFLPTFEEPPAPLPLTQQEAQQQEKVKQTIKEVQTGLGEQHDQKEKRDERIQLERRDAMMKATTLCGKAAGDVISTVKQQHSPSAFKP